MTRMTRKTIAEGKYIALQQRGPWEFAHRSKGSGVVAIIAVTRENELILTEQYRPPVQKNVIDLPAGLSGDIAGAEREPLLKAAKRELLEETGYVSRQWTESYTVPTSAGMSTEMVTLYVAKNCQRKRKVVVMNRRVFAFTSLPERNSGSGWNGKTTSGRALTQRSWQQLVCLHHRGRKLGAGQFRWGSIQSRQFSCSVALA